jgi:hypothetical protein
MHTPTLCQPGMWQLGQNIREHSVHLAGPVHEAAADPLTPPPTAFAAAAGPAMSAEQSL